MYQSKTGGKIVINKKRGPLKKTVFTPSQIWLNSLKEANNKFNSLLSLLAMKNVNEHVIAILLKFILIFFEQNSIKQTKFKSMLPFD